MAKNAWGSKLGVIMAVAGSAVGLGNFLRFPVQVAQNGGGAFMIPYFVMLILMGLPLMWIEWTIGRFGGGFGHSTAPGMFHSLWEKNRFIKYFGVIGIFGPTLIFIYYIYIESWLLAYSCFALFGMYDGCTTKESMSAFLNVYQGFGEGGLLSRMAPAYLFFVITFALNMLIMGYEIKNGIEKVCKYAMPVLFGLAAILLLRVLTLGTPDPAAPDNNIINGLGYMWNPKWSALKDARVWFAAAGQILFTLSCGIGVILTYASYLRKKDDVALSGLTAASTNEFAEVILGGSIVIPAAFAFFGAANMETIAKSGSFNLGFVTMPLVLQHVPFSHIFGFIWFMLLFIAGITSSISLCLPPIAFLEDEFSMSKKSATRIFGTVTFILCQAPIFFLANGVVDELDFWGSNFCLILFAAVESVLFAWVFGMDKAWTELHLGSDITIPKFYRFVIKWITPAVLLFVLGFWLIQEGIPTILMKNIKPEDRIYVITVRTALILLFSVLCFLVWRVWKKREKEVA